MKTTLDDGDLQDGLSLTRTQWIWVLPMRKKPASYVKSRRSSSKFKKGIRAL